MKMDMDYGLDLGWLEVLQVYNINLELKLNPINNYLIFFHINKSWIMNKNIFTKYLWVSSNKKNQ